MVCKRGRKGAEKVTIGHKERTKETSKKRTKKMIKKVMEFNICFMIGEFEFCVSSKYKKWRKNFFNCILELR